jgi:hypothetical protein
VIKHNFDQTPILLENFDQLIRSSEIRSSDPLSKKVRKKEKEEVQKKRNKETKNNHFTPGSL